jgi:hypothetical protein
MSQSLEGRIRASLIALLACAAAAGQPARAIDAVCKPALDAMMKQIATPTTSTRQRPRHRTAASPFPGRRSTPATPSTSR